MELTVMTELDAVNLMLGVIGESPVSSLNVTGLGEVAVAKQTLQEVSRSFQERGWHFNTEDEYELPLNLDGEIAVPANVLRIDVEDSEGFDVVQRGTRMYDRGNHTYTFPRSLKFRITFMLPFEEMPQAARYYIAVSAARLFVVRQLGSEAMEHFTEKDELRALAAVQDMDTDVADCNMIYSNPSSLDILQR